MYVCGSMTDDPPCFAKQGTIWKITGLEPAGGSFAGSGICRPHTVDGFGIGATGATCGRAGPWLGVGGWAEATPMPAISVPATRRMERRPSVGINTWARFIVGEIGRRADPTAECRGDAKR